MEKQEAMVYVPLLDTLTMLLNNETIASEVHSVHVHAFRHHTNFTPVSCPRKEATNPC